jgi:hypothetical protein
MCTAVPQTVRLPADGRLRRPFFWCVFRQSEVTAAVMVVLEEPAQMTAICSKIRMEEARQGYAPTSTVNCSQQSKLLRRFINTARDPETATLLSNSKYTRRALRIG